MNIITSMIYMNFFDKAMYLGYITLIANKSLKVWSLKTSVTA